MGNALYINWSNTQRMLYGIQVASSASTALAFGATITNYVVLELILNSKTRKEEERPRTRALSLIVSSLLYWGLYTALFYHSLINSVLNLGGLLNLVNDQTAYYIVVPVIALLGFIVNLAFEWIWTLATTQRIEPDDDVLKPLLDETVDEEASPAPPVGPSRAPGEQVLAEKKNKKQIYFINNIKIFLTFVVILHHCATGEFGEG